MADTEETPAVEETPAEETPAEETAAATEWTWTAPTTAAWATWSLYAAGDCAEATADTAVVENDASVWPADVWGIAADCAALTAGSDTLTHGKTVVTEASVVVTVHTATASEADATVMECTDDNAVEGATWTLTWTDRAATCVAGPPAGWGFGAEAGELTATAAGWAETPVEEEESDGETEDSGAKALSFFAASAIALAATQF